jgi:hypothetical protein
MAHNVKVLAFGRTHGWNGMRAANSRSTCASGGLLLLRCIMARANSRAARGFATINATPSCAATPDVLLRYLQIAAAPLGPFSR